MKNDEIAWWNRVIYCCLHTTARSQSIYFMSKGNFAICRSDYETGLRYDRPSGNNHLGNGESCQRKPILIFCSSKSMTIFNFIASNLFGTMFRFDIFNLHNFPQPRNRQSLGRHSPFYWHAKEKTRENIEMAVCGFGWVFECQMDNWNKYLFFGMGLYHCLAEKIYSSRLFAGGNHTMCTALMVRPQPLQIKYNCDGQDVPVDGDDNQVQMKNTLCRRLQGVCVATISLRAILWSFGCIMCRCPDICEVLTTRQKTWTRCKRHTDKMFHHFNDAQKRRYRIHDAICSSSEIYFSFFK